MRTSLILIVLSIFTILMIIPVKLISTEKYPDSHVTPVVYQLCIPVSGNMDSEKIKPATNQDGTAKYFQEKELELEQWMMDPEQWKK